MVKDYCSYSIAQVPHHHCLLLGQNQLKVKFPEAVHVQLGNAALLSDPIGHIIIIIHYLGCLFGLELLIAS